MPSIWYASRLAEIEHLHVVWVFNQNSCLNLFALVKNRDKLIHTPRANALTTKITDLTNRFITIIIRNQLCPALQNTNKF